MVIKNIVFPQADSINKIIRLLTTFESSDLSNKDKIMEKFNVVYRQSQYYIDAIRFLGIIDSNGDLTELGRVLTAFESGTSEMCIILRNVIVNKPVFKETYEYYKNNNALPPRNYVSALIKDIYDLSVETSDRRAKTVLRWISWCTDII